MFELDVARLETWYSYPKPSHATIAANVFVKSTPKWFIDGRIPATMTDNKRARKPLNGVSQFHPTKQHSDLLISGHHFRTASVHYVYAVRSAGTQHEINL